MTRFRPFRNSDPPALAELWNLAVPRTATAHPLRVHELDSQAWGTAIFEAAGLIVAEREGRIVGFVHAGFGPDVPVSSDPPLRLSHEVGTVAMLFVEPGPDDQKSPWACSPRPRITSGPAGPRCCMRGGLFPLNPFYWGVYGGSEGTGILSGHQAFHRAVVARGYVPASMTVLLEATSASLNRATPALR